jgi:hypothetical protein
LNKDITAYRKHLIYNALLGSITEEVASAFLGEDVSNNHAEVWRIIGLAQRADNRRWLNINETIAQCNTQFHTNQIVCVEVDVANLPTNFVGNCNNEVLTGIQEQLVMYRSIIALVGIHGSHLTQGVLMPSGSVMMEMFQWFPREEWGGVIFISYYLPPRQMHS